MDSEPISLNEAIGPAASAAVGSTRERVKSFVHRVERLEEDKKGIAEDIKEVFSEAKGEGFDVKALKEVIRLRKIAADERAQQEELVNLYMDAVGETRQGMLI